MKEKKEKKEQIFLEFEEFQEIIELEFFGGGRFKNIEKTEETTEE